MIKMECKDRLTPNTISVLKKEIVQHKGREIFAVGVSDREGRVSEIKVVARGTETKVPALRPFAETGDVVIHNHPSGNLIPSEADVAIAAQLGDLGIGFYIVDNSLNKLTVIAEPITTFEKVLLEPAKLKELITAKGEFARIFVGFEERPQQQMMLERVAQAFNQDEILIVEAGTGVGKSVAYLIPALYWVKQNRERVVISTATINLQEQLIEKDIPLVQRLLAQPISVMLLKGRGNYLCKARLAEALEESLIMQEETEMLKLIYEWSLTSATGCRSDLSFYPPEHLWSEICSEADSCLSLNCRFREDCFVLKLRKEATKAQILVVNHHLFFSDTALKLEAGNYSQTAVLPPFQRLIFDEAHNLERSATSFFSQSLTKYSIRKIINRIYREKKGRVAGLLMKLKGLFPANKYLQNIPDKIKAILALADNLNINALGLLAFAKSLALTDIPQEKLTTILDPSLQELQYAILDLINLFEDFFNEVSFPSEEQQNLEIETRQQLKRLLKHAELIKDFLNRSEKKESVFWLESFKSHRQEQAVRFYQTPLEIAPLMQEAVFEHYATIVFTSATLSCVNDFSYWKKRTGLYNFKERNIRELILTSPFPYQERVLVAVPLDIPEPEQNGYQEFLEIFIYKALLISQGRALLLFTAYEQLNKIYQVLAPKLSEAQISLLKQGSEERARLFQRFVTEASSVLLATDSFWEGVDSPGETLEMVMLCRLPFRVPNEPIIKARLKRIEEEGGNAFLELSLPEAVMRFRQGFGRLMRRKTDRGVVVVLDSRIVKKSYGQFFLQALPPAQRCLANSCQVLKEIKDFFARVK